MNKYLFLTPTADRPGLLKNCIEYARSQTFSNWEQWICVEGSLHNYKEIVDSFQDDRLKFFTKPDWSGQGGWKARNLLLNYLETNPNIDYVIHLNDDNPISPYLLETLDSENVDKKYDISIFKIKYNTGEILPPDFDEIKRCRIDALNFCTSARVSTKFRWAAGGENDFDYFIQCVNYCKSLGLAINYVDKVLGEHR